jgi:thermitase
VTVPARPGGPLDPWWPREWGLARVGLPALWRTTVGSPNVVVAVVDTGVDVGRPDLAGSALPGHNTVDGSDDVRDEVGHGTMVAEVALGRGNNRRQGTGVCWRCKLLPVKVAPNGAATGDQLAAGITWAADNGADVINISLVLKGRDDAVEQAVAHAIARGAVLVASAGNDGGSAASYPASYGGVIGVVGVDPNDRPYPWSTRGAWAGLSAPGCAVVADAGGRATNFCGSSAAAPVVSGLAALLLSAGTPRDRVAPLLVAAAVRGDGTVASAGRVDAIGLSAGLRRK